MLDGIQHKVESQIRKGMDCLAHAKAELQVRTPFCITLHAACYLIPVAHIVRSDTGVSTAVCVVENKPLGLCYLYCLPLCIQPHVDKLIS